jgi:hypothetical protein
LEYPLLPSRKPKRILGNPKRVAAGTKHPGHRNNLEERSGTFLTVSDTAISYRDATGERSIQRQDVRSVKLQNNHRLRNTLIFAGIGAGAGAGIGAASVQQTGSIILGVSRGKGAAVGAVIGVVAGAAVGSLLPAHSTIYSASSH